MTNSEAVDYIQKKVTAALLISGKLVETNAKEICPVDSGYLRDSITTELISSDTVRVYTNTEYAPYVELGTIRQVPQPFLRFGLIIAAEEIKNIFADVFKK